jgi:molecular chaperone GrpE (heat shock protein)
MSFFKKALGLDGNAAAPPKDVLTKEQAEAIVGLLKSLDDRLAGIDEKMKSQERVETALAQTIPMIQFMAKGQDKKFMEARAHLTSEVDRLGQSLRMEAGKQAALDIFKALLPSIDDMDHVLEQKEEPSLAMIQKKLKEAFAKLGIEEIPVEAGKTQFDSTLHEGERAEGAPPGAEKGTIVSTMRAGYRMGDLLIRPSKVTVA